jgi:hypothetical protein
MREKPLSATMAIAMVEAIEHGGKLMRHQGGHWTYPGAAPTAVIGHPYDWWCGDNTINALVDRGRLKFTEWKEGRGTRFPIAAEVVEC